MDNGHPYDLPPPQAGICPPHIAKSRSELDEKIEYSLRRLEKNRHAPYPEVGLQPAHEEDNGRPKVGVEKHEPIYDGRSNDLPRIGRVSTAADASGAVPGR